MRMLVPGRRFIRPLPGALILVWAALSWGAIAPAGAAADPSPGQVSSFTYGTGDTAHAYLVYTPKGWTAAARMPLLVMLHGCQTTAYQQMEANLYNPLADAKGFVVAYPDSDAIENDAPGPLKRCFRFYDPQDHNRGEDDTGAVAAITQAVIRGWNIDPERVYVMGMSGGSFLTADLSAAYPDLYAASGENAGGAYADGTCLFSPALSSLSAGTSAQLAFAEMGSRARVVPRIVIGGDDDQGVPPACADKALQQAMLTDNLVIDGTESGPISPTPTSVTQGQVPGGYAYTTSDYTDEHGCLVGERILVHGMNHFWSGGSPDPQWKDFTDPKGPSAAQASWDFFSRFTLANTADSCAAAPPPTTHKPAPKRGRHRRRPARGRHAHRPAGQGPRLR